MSCCRLVPPIQKCVFLLTFETRKKERPHPAPGSFAAEQAIKINLFLAPRLLVDSCICLGLIKLDKRGGREDHLDQVQYST
jgi:hypothetical protein